MTNYERIKSMTVEEMAMSIYSRDHCLTCPLFPGCKVSGVNCLEEIEKWLMQEVDK